MQGGSDGQRTPHLWPDAREEDFGLFQFVRTRPRLALSQTTGWRAVATARRSTSSREDNFEESLSMRCRAFPGESVLLEISHLMKVQA